MRKEKQLLLDEIKDNLEQASTFVLASYQKIDPNLAAEFRMTLTDSGGFFQVVKKRILVKAAIEAGITLDLEGLQGHIGIIYAGEDSIAAAKTIYRFKEANADLLEILGGFFEGKKVSSKEIEELSKLPSKEQMRAEFLGLLEAPLSQTVGVLEALLSGLVSCIDQKTQKEEL